MIAPCVGLSLSLVRIYVLEPFKKLKKFPTSNISPSLADSPLFPGKKAPMGPELLKVSPQLEQQGRVVAEDHSGQRLDPLLTVCQCMRAGSTV